MAESKRVDEPQTKAKIMNLEGRKINGIVAGEKVKGAKIVEIIPDPSGYLYVFEGRNPVPAGQVHVHEILPADAPVTDIKGPPPTTRKERTGPETDPSTPPPAE